MIVEGDFVVVYFICEGKYIGILFVGVFVMGKFVMFFFMILLCIFDGKMIEYRLYVDVCDIFC